MARHERIVAQRSHQFGWSISIIVRCNMHNHHGDLVYDLESGPGELLVYRATNSEVALEYEVQGTGEPVLLTHVGRCAASFAPAMDEPASAGYRLVRYHRRGYVGSSAARAR
jgi:hypothetical protein